MEFIADLSQAAHWFFITSLKAVIVIALIMMIRLVFGDRLPAKWQYALWFLLIIRLVLPFELPSPLSLFNLTEQVTYESQQLSLPLVEPQNHDIVVEPQAVQSITIQSQAIPATRSTEPASLSLGFMDILGLVWLTVTILLTLYALILNVRTWLNIQRQHPLIDSRLKRSFQRSCARLDIRRNIAVYVIDNIQSPFWFGLLSPRIYFPKHLIEKMGDNDLDHIFLHELAHFKRKDLVVAHLQTMLQVLHWFNPFIWYSFWKMRSDRETACDEMVLNTLGAEKSELYGKTIISVLRQASRGRLLPVTIALADSRENLTRRVNMIANFTQKSKWWVVFAVAAAFVISTLAFTAAVKKSELVGSWWENSLWPDYTVYLTVEEISDNEISLIYFTPRGNSYDARRLIGEAAAPDSFLCTFSYYIVTSDYSFDPNVADTIAIKITSDSLCMRSVVKEPHPLNARPRSFGLSNTRIFGDDLPKLISCSWTTESIQDKLQDLAGRKKAALYYLPEPQKSEFHDGIRKFVHGYYDKLDHFTPETQMKIKDFAFNALEQVWYAYKNPADSLILHREIQSIKEGQDGYYDRQMLAFGFYDKPDNPEIAYEQFIFSLFETNLSLLDQKKFLNHVSANHMDDTDKYDQAYLKKVNELVEQYPNDEQLQRMLKTVTTMQATRQLKEGNIFPRLVFSSLDGRRHRISDFKGKHVFIDFWGTWCAPCVDDQPSLLKLYENYKDKPIQFLSLSTDDKETLEKYLKQKSITLEQYLVSMEKLKRIGVISYPTYFLLDPKGKILLNHQGGGTGLEWADKEIKKYLAL